MTDLLWAAGNTTNYNRIFKAQFGTLFMRDNGGAATALDMNFSPFTSDSTAIDFATLEAAGWINMGSTDENGAQFQPKYTTADTNVWQTRMPVRTDVESDQDEVMLTLMEATSAVDAIYEQKALTGRPADGSAGYAITSTGVAPLYDRQAIIIGVDQQGGLEEYAAVVYPLCRNIKKDKRDWQPKNASTTPITLDSYPDPFSGYARRFLRGGPRWLASGGTTGPVGVPVAAAISGDKATLTFQPPQTGSGSYTYSVQQTTGGTTTAVSAGNVTVTSQSSSQVVLTVSGLTTGDSYTFTVTATSTTNGSAATSTASNSVTATA